MRAPAIADVVLAVLLAGLVLVLESPPPALAHAGHEHAPLPATTPAHPPARPFPLASAAASTPVSPPVLPAAVMAPSLAAAAGTAALATQAPAPWRPPVHAHAPFTGPSAAAAPTVPGAPRHLDSCCCGSLACQAGVMAAFVTIDNPYRLGQRWRPWRARAAVPAARDGIERPPRARIGA